MDDRSASQFGARRVVLALLSCLVSTPDALPAQEPPAELFFNQAGLQHRVRLDPPPTVVSGDFQLQLVELDHVSAGSQRGLRLLVRATALEGELPADLVVIGPAWALTGDGRKLPVSGYEVVADGAAQWLALSLTGEAEQLAIVTAAVGPRPRSEELAVAMDLGRLGEVWRLPEVDQAIGLALVRREPTPLPLLEAPPPLYRARSGSARFDAPAAGCSSP